MIQPDSPAGSRYAGAGWFAVAAVTSVGASLLFRIGGPYNPTLTTKYGVLITLGLVGLVAAGLAVWRMVRVRADSWLLPLAALNLLLLEPGRAGDAATWRLEWGGFGLAFTVAAALLFTRLLARTDELQRRVYLEGAAAGLLMALPLAMAYALFEPRLPPLRAQWVTMALLVLWWGGWLGAARRYR